MTLYKNVDLCDLESILKDGLLPMDACRNDNWSNGRRVANATDVVYLFSPSGKQNSFVQYGAALLEVEVEVENAQHSELTERDVNKGKYEEYVVKHVPATNIKHIYIPKILRSRVDASFADDRIVWCEMYAEEFDSYEPNEDSPYGWGGITYFKPVTAERMTQFAKTAPIESADAFNFFRGTDEENCMIDLRNVVYKTTNKK